ncbi:hypothetical protein Raf01_58510 [Rugosimonospora africana]|uniref:Uncharacterized protein n=1 Tax=Rugosimonospora africana TaxID=556532 RepID=A0A8J3VT36_9ACTN|nr:hypothetical protein Raf01_58510 [Rugosimonospora africana]
MRVPGGMTAGRAVARQAVSRTRRTPDGRDTRTAEQATLDRHTRDVDGVDVAMRGRVGVFTAAPRVPR